jgi:hypothetical protein
MRHALEPDHLAAMSTLLTTQRSPRRIAVLGVFWGLGHSLALLGLGGSLALVGQKLPGRWATGFELGVSLLLLVLGARALRSAWQRPPAEPARLHTHGETRHRHSGTSAHLHVGRWTMARRPLLIGAVHGLAGSGSLTALALANMPSAAMRLLYIAVFGLGSLLGMAALSGLAGWPLARLGQSPLAQRAMSVAVGVASIGLGLYWGRPLLGRLLT